MFLTAQTVIKNSIIKSICSVNITLRAIMYSFLSIILPKYICLFYYSDRYNHQSTYIVYAASDGLPVTFNPSQLTLLARRPTINVKI